MTGIVVSSRNKKSHAKHYSARDDLAFRAWDLQGFYPDYDKDFVTWKKQQEARKNNSKGKKRWK